MDVAIHLFLLLSDFTVKNAINHTVEISVGVSDYNTARIFLKDNMYILDKSYPGIRRNFTICEFSVN